MPCVHYKDALIEIAASGSTPQGELRSHLDKCASCRAAFDQEQSLFAAIDCGLHAAINEKAPSSLLPRVRAQLDEVIVPRLGWLQPLVFASVSVALAFGVFLVARPHHVTPEEVAKHGPMVVPAPTPGATMTNPEETSEGTRIATISVSHSHISRNSTGVHSAASSNPEVLVPPDEREAFGRLVAVLNERSDVGASLVAKVPEKPENRDSLETMDPLSIPDIEIKPLEGTKAETSDGAAEKH